MLPTLFCPQCFSFLGPHASGCARCDWIRPAGERFYIPGQPAWSGILPGMASAPVTITSEVILFIWKQLAGKGGLVAFSAGGEGKRRWQIDLPYSLEGSVIVEGNACYFTTLGMLDQGAYFYSARLVDGTQIWEPKSLSGGAWSPPVMINQVHAFIATSQGLIHHFNLETGQEVNGHFPLDLHLSSPEKVYLASDGKENLVVATQKGQVFLLRWQDGASRWFEPVQIACEITSPPLLSGDNLFLGAAEGQVFRLDLSSRQLTRLASGYKGVVAQAASRGRFLFVGAHDHCLHMLDITSGEEIHRWEFERSISCSPLVFNDLAIVGANDGKLHFLDTRSGSELWSYSTPNLQPIFTRPVIYEDQVYFGAQDGSVYALPWHCGYYEKAAAYLERNRAYDQAAPFYCLAASLPKLKSEERHALYQKAADCWQQACQPEQAARLWEGLGQFESAADSFLEAAESQCSQDARLAVTYYDQAEKLYRKTGALEKAVFCSARAAHFGHRPKLSTSAWNNPELNQWDKGKLTIRVENQGDRDASLITVKAGGSLVEDICFQVVDSLSAGKYFDIRFEIIPTRLEDTLKVQIEYLDPIDTGRVLQDFLALAIKARPQPHEIELDSLVMGDITILNPSNQRLKLKVKDQVMTHLKIGLGAEQESPDPSQASDTPEVKPESPRICPVCKAEVRPEDAFCQACGRPLKDN